jgi:hypothetical protein
MEIDQEELDTFDSMDFFIEPKETINLKKLGPDNFVHSAQGHVLKMYDKRNVNKPVM